MYGTYKVRAETLEDAIYYVKSASVPFDELPEGDYIDDSLVVGVECIRLTTTLKTVA